MSTKRQPCFSFCFSLNDIIMASQLMMLYSAVYSCNLEFPSFFRVLYKVNNNVDVKISTNYGEYEKQRLY